MPGYGSAIIALLKPASTRFAAINHDLRDCRFNVMRCVTRAVQAGGKMKVAFSSALAFLVMTCASVAFPAQMAAAQTVLSDPAEGKWEGEFGQAVWLIELSHKDGIWSGRYMSSTINAWRPLYALTVSGRNIAFSIKSQPPLRFALSVDEAGRKITGQASITDGIALPFVAIRKP